MRLTFPAAWYREIMTNPVIKLPAQFDGQTLAKVAADVVASCREGFPDKLIFDFAQLDFIRPAGVVFLSNLINWLSEKGTKADFVNCDPRDSSDGVGQCRFLSGDHNRYRNSHGYN